MPKKEPILFDPDKPLAHYEKALALKKKTDRTLNNGKIVPVAAFLIGSACVIYDPLLMAMMALFGFIFCILAFIGCWTRFPKMCFMSIPLGIAAAAAAALSGSEIAPIGTCAFILASGMQVFAINAAAEFQILKELPGFPFFDPSMDDITFAAMDRFGSDQFIDDSSLHEENKERAKYVPIGDPSDEMEELSSPDGELADKNAPEKEAEDPKPKKNIVWDMEEKRSKSGQDTDISDMELFDM